MGKGIDLAEMISPTNYETNSESESGEPGKAWLKSIVQKSKNF